MDVYHQKDVVLTNTLTHHISSIALISAINRFRPPQLLHHFCHIMWMCNP